jgi:formate dehydrogenase iron-sulfur subunit
MMHKAILFDATQCMACRGCQVACKQWNELSGERTRNSGSYENPPSLSAKTWLKIKFIESENDGMPTWKFSRQACMHCTDAACVTVCPTKALYHNELGMVSYNKDACSGCGYCADFCPFDVPCTDGNLVCGVAKIAKCTMCTSGGLDRIAAGEQPTCVKTCPSSALKFGDRDQLLAEGREKVATLKQQGFGNAYLYGEKELRGLHVLYVLDDMPEAYGLPANPTIPAVAGIWKNMLQPAGWALGGLTLAGLALNYLIARQAKVAAEKNGKKEG